MLESEEKHFFSSLEEKKRKQRLERESCISQLRPPSQLVCPICKSKTVSYKSTQRRRLDEPEDIDCNCLSCQAVWRIRN